MQTTGTPITIPQIINNAEGLYEGNLKHYLRVLWFDADNLENPYHNLRHILHVLWLCYDACRYYQGKLTPRKMRNLLIAALFHDFDHTGRSGLDDINIEFAIKALNKHIATEDTGRDQSDIADLIRYSRWPHVIPSEIVPLTGQILRDADVSQGLDHAWIQQAVLGLAGELRKHPIDLLRQQAPFFENLHFSTDWAQHIFPKTVIAAKITEAEQMLAILTESSTA